MVLMKKQTYRQMEHNRRSRNKSTQLKPAILTKMRKTYIREKITSSTNGIWKIEYPQVED
jgi:hypothetical protein